MSIVTELVLYVVTALLGFLLGLICGKGYSNDYLEEKVELLLTKKLGPPQPSPPDFDSKIKSKKEKPQYIG